MMSGFETEGPPANNDPTLAELDCVQVKTHIDVLSPVSVDVHLDAVRALSIMMSSMKLRVRASLPLSPQPHDLPESLR